MKVINTDPMTMESIPDPEGHPYVIEGSGEHALKIYFESLETKRAYLEAALPEREEEAS